MTEQREKPLGDLLGDLGRQVGTLVRREMDLARVELTDRASRLGRDTAMVAAGGAILHGALLVLLAAAVLGLMAAGLDGWPVLHFERNATISYLPPRVPPRRRGHRRSSRHRRVRDRGPSSLHHPP